MTRHTSPFSQSVIDQASAWAVRLGGGDMSEADYLALEAWLAASPDHPHALTEAEQLWAALDDDRGALDAALTQAAAATAPTISALASRKRSPNRRWRWAGGGLAAALAAGLLLLPLLSDRTSTYVTAPGEQKTITLRDGSSIAMNGGSELSVRLSGKERLIEMKSAEAAFDVAHDAQRPFRVTVGESRIEVLGTAFDVRRDGGKTTVNVSRGVVRVSELADPAHNVRLTMGQAVTLVDGSHALEVTQGSTETAGWRAGRLVYDNRPLSDVAADLSRAYPTPVRAVGDAADIRFTGTLVLDDQASTLRRLEAFLPISASRADGAVQLRSREAAR